MGGITMKDKKTLYIVQTAVMLALLIAVQFFTHAFSTFITGSLVNLILLVSVLIIGYGGGLIIALVSPFCAFFMGVGPAFIQIVPFVAVGNAIFISIAWLFRKFITAPDMKKKRAAIIGLVLAGLVKMLFLWIGLVTFMLPMIPGLNAAKQSIIGAAFTWPQIITALIGSALALLIVPLIRRALKTGA